MEHRRIISNHPETKEDEIAVGITRDALVGKRVLQKLNVDGTLYFWKRIASIPSGLTKQIFSVSIYSTTP